MHRSHLTQLLLNHFDEQDRRVRESPYTLDAQLLNAFAQSIEFNDMRITRETNGRYLRYVPLEIDSRGVYYRFPVPASVNLPVDPLGNWSPFTDVWGWPGPTGATWASPGPTGDTGPTGPSGATGDWIELSLYDDTLPVPTRVEADPTIAPLSITNPIVFEVIGTDNPITVYGTTGGTGPIALPMPNRLTFWLDQVGGPDPVVDIRIEGEVYPAPVWADEENEQSEEVFMYDSGVVESNMIWQTVDDVVIHGLPAGARLRCWSLPLTLDAVPDPMRPFIDPQWRGLLFPRFWLYNGLLVEELCQRNRFAGLEYVQSYLMSAVPTGIAVEPNTNGLFVAAGTTLYYADRREPLPSNLQSTGMGVEPLYGLSCGHDPAYPPTQAGSVRYLMISAVAYSGWANAVSYRYLLTDPSGNTYCLDEKGGLLQYRSSSGWRLTPPTKVVIPLVQTGTYLVTLQCMDKTNAITQDYFPYVNQPFTPLAVFDLSGLVSNIQGLAFDSHQRLWVWDGSTATPLRFHYDGYVVDQSSQAIYLTDPYTEISIN